MDIMTLSSPTPTANQGNICNVDSFKAVSGTSQAASTPPNPPTLCGVNDGNHSKNRHPSLYVDLMFTVFTFL